MEQEYFTNLENQRTKAGNFMYNLVNKGSIFIGKHVWLYWLLNLTWGLIYTLVGYLVALVVLLCKAKPTKYHHSFYQTIGKYWGGVSFGTNYLVCSAASDDTKAHEYGHTHQNALLGPLFIFLVALPSAVRYWYRRLKGSSATAYDLIWFEGSASYIGYVLTSESEENE